MHVCLHERRVEKVRQEMERRQEIRKKMERRQEGREVEKIACGHGPR